MPKRKIIYTNPKNTNFVTLQEKTSCAHAFLEVFQIWLYSFALAKYGYKSASVF